MQNDQADDFLDQMPFTVYVEWENKLIELVIVPYWDEKAMDTSFTVMQGQHELGTLRRKDTIDEQWEWIAGGLESEKAELIGDKINSHFL
jgi:hypothetical protein